MIALGDPANPMSRSDAESKFMSLATRSLKRDAAAELMDAVRCLTEGAAVTRVIELMK